jgi:hypothetical protein
LVKKDKIENPRDLDLVARHVNPVEVRGRAPRPDFELFHKDA